LAENAVHEDDQIDRQIEIVEAFDDLLARPAIRSSARNMNN
jgi:hypothetical protein